MGRKVWVISNPSDSPAVPRLRGYAYFWRLMTISSHRAVAPVAAHLPCLIPPITRGRDARASPVQEELQEGRKYAAERVSAADDALERAQDKAGRLSSQLERQKGETAEAQKNAADAETRAAAAAKAAAEAEAIALGEAEVAAKTKAESEAAVQKAQAEVITALRARDTASERATEAEESALGAKRELVEAGREKRLRPSGRWWRRKRLRQLGRISRPQSSWLRSRRTGRCMREQGQHQR
jgi:hypothetical protein